MEEEGNGQDTVNTHARDNLSDVWRRHVESEERLIFFKGAIKSHHMFILSYVTFYFWFCDAKVLLHSAILIPEFTFSFHLPGQPHVQNHVSGKEN